MQRSDLNLGLYIAVELVGKRSTVYGEAGADAVREFWQAGRSVTD